METTLQNPQIKAVISSTGAELKSLEKNGENFIWEINTEFWGKTSPVLFPIVGGLKNNEYEFEGKKYTLPRHGFAREKDFELISVTEDLVVFQLTSDENSKKIFPFDFEFRIIYKIVGSELFVKYEIQNTGNTDMFFAVGAHPAFAIHGYFTDYSLEFDAEKKLITHHLEDNLFSGITEEIPTENGVLPLNYQLFETDALIFKNYTTTCLTLLHFNQPKLKVNFQEFPFLGIWTKKDAPFLCIEPWLGIADHKNTSGKITEKEGIQRLNTNGIFSAQWSVEIF